jgi:ATP-dependent Clp protease protease subunit
MIHQPMSFAEGQASDIEITAKEVMGVKKDLIEILAERSGKNYKQVEMDSDRDYWMTAKETKKYGIIDIIL